MVYGRETSSYIPTTRMRRGGGGGGTQIIGGSRSNKNEFFGHKSVDRRQYYGNFILNYANYGFL